MMEINPAELTTAQKAALVTRLKREAVRRAAVAAWPNAHRMSVALDDKLRRTQMLDMIAGAVQETVDTDRGRLIISSPPQIGKSMTVAIWGAVRALVGNPDLRIVVASYSESLARRHVRTARDLVSEYGSGAKDSLTRMPLPDRLGISLDDRKATETEWQVAGAQGGMYAVGVGGSLSGKPADCVVGETVVYSEYGPITAAQAYANPPRYLLGYDERTGRPAWHRLEATRRIERRPVVTVSTRGGESLTCTADHRVYTGGGYSPAGDLRPGETLLHLATPPGMPDLLDALRLPAGGRAEGSGPRRADVLLDDVRLGGRLPTVSGEVLSLRQAGPPESPVDVLRRVFTGEVPAGATTRRLPGVRAGVHGDLLPDRVLFPDVRGPGALETDDRGGELPSSASLLPDLPLPADQTLDHREGRLQVRDLRDPDGPNRSSLRRGPGEQPGGEPDNPLRLLPHNAPQIGGDSVSVVADAGEATVYDFQVAGDHNFFANGILVHNCLIIDDPIKGMTEADSELYRRRLMDWWQSVALARLSPTASVILVQTRWSEEDLAGALLKEGGWRYLNFPAVSEEGIPDALNRRPGTPLRTSRGHTTETWDSTREAVGQRVWHALYQGVPTPTGGGLFHASSLDRFRDATETPLRLRIVAVDPAETGDGDEAGIIAVGLTGDGRVAVTHDESGQMNSAEWSRRAVILALRTKASELSFEGYTTATTYNRVILDAWKDVERDLRLIRTHRGDVIAAALTLDSSQGDPLERLSELEGLTPSGSDRPPFRIRAWRGKGDKVARASGARQASETGRLFMSGTFPALERQAVTWQVGQSSPDRVDALVQGYERMRELMGKPSIISTPNRVVQGQSGLGSRLSATLE